MVVVVSHQNVERNMNNFIIIEKKQIAIFLGEFLDKHSMADGICDRMLISCPPIFSILSNFVGQRLMTGAALFQQQTVT